MCRTAAGEKIREKGKSMKVSVAPKELHQTSPSLRC